MKTNFTRPKIQHLVAFPIWEYDLIRSHWLGHSKKYHSVKQMISEMVSQGIRRDNKQRQ